MKRFLFIFNFFSSLCCAHPLVDSARAQIGRTLCYNPAYRVLCYPMGDVPLQEGVCSDVIIRAFRTCYKIDLQQVLHEHIKKKKGVYPNLWGLKKPDPNIDHRRVPNLAAFFHHHGLELKGQPYQPGDILIWNVMGLPHIGIVSNQTNADKVPLILHNIGQGTQEEDFLNAPYPVMRHFRVSQAFIHKYCKASS